MSAAAIIATWLLAMLLFVRELRVELGMYLLRQLPPDIEHDLGLSLLVLDDRLAGAVRYALLPVHILGWAALFLINAFDARRLAAIAALAERGR